MIWRLLSLRIGTLALTLSVTGCGGHPSSASMIHQFHEHRKEFEETLQMFLIDKELGRVAPHFTRPDDPSKIGVSPERIARYRMLLRSAGVSDGIEGYGRKDEICFRVSDRGLSISGSAKGIAWRTGPPEPAKVLVDDLDAYLMKMFPGDHHSFTAYQRIEGNWYLYYDYED